MASMRFGIHTIEDYSPATHKPLPEFYDDLVDRAVLAEELGYESFWVTEHHFHWFGGAHANPIVLLSAVAARTRTIRLGTAVTLLPYWHPLKVAEEFACLDNLSHGRVDLGVGRGFFKLEWDGLGLSMAESRPRFDESLALIQRLWTEERVSHRGTFWNFEDVELVPKPVQRPHPPIWVAGTFTPESFSNAGRLGMPLMVVPYVAIDLDDIKQKVGLYKEGWREGGHRGEPTVLGFFLTYISDDESTLQEQLEDRVRFYKDVNQVPERRMQGERDAQQYGNFEGTLEKMGYMQFGILQESNKALFGTPSHIAEVVRLWEREAGMNYVTIMPSWGQLPEETVRTTMRRFATEVIPLFSQRG